MGIEINIKESNIEFYESWNKYVNRNISNKNLRSDFIGILNDNKFTLTYKNIIRIFMMIFAVIGLVASAFRIMNTDELGIMNKSYPTYMAMVWLYQIKKSI